VVDDLESLSKAFRSRLEGMASASRANGKVDRQVLIDVVLQLCEGRFVTLRCLVELVNRKPDTFRDHYLKMLIRQRQLNLAFPKTPNHERQAYTTNGQQAWRVMLTAGCEMLLDGGAGALMVRGILQLNAAPLRNLLERTDVARD